MRYVTWLPYIKAPFELSVLIDSITVAFQEHQRSMLVAFWSGPLNQTSSPFSTVSKFCCSTCSIFPNIINPSFYVFMKFVCLMFVWGGGLGNFLFEVSCWTAFHLSSLLICLPCYNFPIIFIILCFQQANVCLSWWAGKLSVWGLVLDYSPFTFNFDVFDL